MFVSVVVPTYKRQEKLSQTLESLRDQTYPKNSFEVLIVEDGSREAQEVVERIFSLSKLNYHYFWQENAGPAKARNLGVDKAKGEIIAFTDDDCVVPENWLEKIVEGFKKHPEVAGVGGYLEANEEMLKKNIFARYERFVSRRDYVQTDRELISGFTNPAGGTNNVAYKKKVLEEAQGFDESFPVAAGEDADLKWRITQKGHQLLFIPLKVEHHQTYTLSSFLKQSFNRGIGSYYFEKKWDKAPAKTTLYFRGFYLPIKLIRDLLFGKERLLSFLDFLSLFKQLQGELKYSK